jgi:hypothetical protein
MSKRAHDASILRNVILRAGIPAPMRALLLYLVAACRNNAYTYATVEIIMKQTGIGKQRYYKLMKKLERLGVIHRLAVSWDRTIGNITFINKNHALLRSWKGGMLRQPFDIDRQDVIEGVLALLDYRRKAPKGNACPGQDNDLKIIAACLRTLRKRGMLRNRQAQTAAKGSTPFQKQGVVHCGPVQPVKGVTP